MNKEEIDKWLDNEYGTSYTKLEELHDYFFEKYTDQKEEIKRLNKQIEEYQKALNETTSEKMDLENIIKEVREYIVKHQCCDGKINVMTLTEYKELLEILDKGE